MKVVKSSSSGSLRGAGAADAKVLERLAVSECIFVVTLLQPHSFRSCHVLTETGKVGYIELTPSEMSQYDQCLLRTSILTSGYL